MDDFNERDASVEKIENLTEMEIHQQLQAMIDHEEKVEYIDLWNSSSLEKNRDRERERKKERMQVLISGVEISFLKKILVIKQDTRKFMTFNKEKKWGR